MRAAFQILAIPYRREGASILYGVFHRADHDQWQFIAGGGANDEAPLQAAQRETWEESGVRSARWTALTSMTYIPATVIAQKHRQHWRKDTYVIPEYAFAFQCDQPIRLSEEHTTFAWLTYDQACEILQWDSNRTALYELQCRLMETNAPMA